MSEEKKLNGTVIVTYRCNARCSMCNRYKAPSKPEEEISIETIKKLPKMYFTNITGGEPFIRTDLKDIVRELYKKSDRKESFLAVFYVWQFAHCVSGGIANVSVTVLLYTIVYKCLIMLPYRSTKSFNRRRLADGQY